MFWTSELLPVPFTNTTAFLPCASVQSNLVAPKWSIEPSDTNIVRGSASSVDCMATGFPPARIIWTKAAGGGGGGGAPGEQAKFADAKSNHLGSWVSIRNEFFGRSRRFARG